MKRLMFLLCSCLLVMGANAYDSSTVNERVLRIFNETFGGAQEVKWNEFDKYYSVSFVMSGVRSKVDYDKEGNMLTSIRYYQPNILPFNILSKLKKQYPARSLYGVTEITTDNSTTYYVKMEDEKHWYTIKVDASGGTELYEKYRKA